MEERVIPVFIAGARGRMGEALIRSVVDSENLTLVGAVDRSDVPGIGQDAGTMAHTTTLGVRISDDFMPRRGSVVVDFSLPELVSEHLEICAEVGVPVVLGPAGRAPETEAALKAAAQSIPIVHSVNYSVGITLLKHVAEFAARVLGTDWDAEILELHHAHKRKAPSGTAQRMGERLAAAFDRDPKQCLVSDRGPSSRPRQDGDIGVVSLRGGDSAGEHAVDFFGHGERIELTHRANDRAVFARGALRAARWISEQSPGLYDMRDVLGLGAEDVG